jgi:cytidylate kinase
VLADRPDVLSVRLAGPAEDRVAQTVARSGGDEVTVRAEQKATDAAREAYVQAFYNVRQSDPTLYHLIIDSTVVSYDACAEIIVAAAKDRFHAT